MEWAKWDNYSHEHNSTAMAKYQAQPSPSSQLSTIHKPAFIDKTTIDKPLLVSPWPETAHITAHPLPHSHTLSSSSVAHWGFFFVVDPSFHIRLPILQ